MKYYKRKQVARFTLFGKDDLNYTTTTSMNIDNGTATKKMTFNVQGLPNCELSNNALLVLESVFIKNRTITEEMYIGRVVVRFNSVNNTAMWDSDGKRLKPVLLWNGSHTNSQLWNNPSPDIFYNFPISRNFLQNTQLNLEVEFETDFTTSDANRLAGFKDFALSFVLYDYDVEEVKNVSEIDFKRMFMGRETTDH